MGDALTSATKSERMQLRGSGGSWQREGTIAGVATTVYSGWLGMEDSCHQVISTRFIIPRRLNHFFIPSGTYHRAELPICRTEASSVLVRHSSEGVRVTQMVKVIVGDEDDIQFCDI
jgi:hypothetical protein